MTQPMDLANMRENGVREITLWCSACGHYADVNVDDLPGDIAVPSIGRRYRCGACGSKTISSRPAWHQRPTPRAP